MLGLACLVHKSTRALGLGHCVPKSGLVTASRKAARDLRPNLEQYEDDYTINAPAYCTGPNAPNPRAAPAHASRPRSAPVDPPRDRSANSRSADPPRGQAAVHASTPAVAGPSRARPASTIPRTQDDHQTTSVSSSSRDDSLLPASTERQNRKADKQTAAEEARAKAKAQVQAQAAKGQGQPSTPALDDESEDNDEATRQLAKKVKAGPHAHARIMSPELDSETEPAPTTGSKKGKASQAARALTKAPTKAATKTSAKRKADEESVAKDEETQVPKPPNKRGKTSQTTQATKHKAEEEPVIEEEPPEEIEVPQLKKRKIQPHMCPPPPPNLESQSSSAPLPPDTPASQPTEDVIQISSSDPPEPGSSRTPIAVNSSDPPSETVGRISSNNLCIISVSTIKVPRPKKAPVPVPASNCVFRERKQK